MDGKLKNNGFSLPELLVAIAILALMAVGIFSITQYTQSHGKITTTETAIAILDTALEQYYEFYGKFPDVNNTDETEFVYYKLTLCPDAKKTIGNIGRAMLKKVGSYDYPEIIDVWEEELKYVYDDEIHNFPLITSSGPDKDFDTDEDNITNR